MAIKARIDEALDLSVDELKDELPSLLDDLDDDVIDLVENNPELLPRLFSKMEEIDISEVANDTPEVVDQFQEFLWDATEELIKRDEEIQSVLNQNITVNFEASDSPMEGRLSVDADNKTITGAPEHAPNADMVITADSNTLIELLIGKVDPVQGFMTNQYEMDGPISKGVKLIPVLNAMADKYTGI